MKLFLAMFAFVGLLTQSHFAAAAIGCLPGECGGGGGTPHPSPGYPGGCYPAPTDIASLRVKAFQGCASETVESCDKCDATATSCLPNFTAGNHAVTCVYCAQ